MTGLPAVNAVSGGLPGGIAVATTHVSVIPYPCETETPFCCHNSIALFGTTVEPVSTQRKLLRSTVPQAG